MTISDPELFDEEYNEAKEKLMSKEELLSIIVSLGEEL